MSLVRSSEFNLRLGTKNDLYEALNAIYYLPARTSHALTKNYLKMVMDISKENILRIKRKDITIRSYLHHKISRDEVHKYVKDKTLVEGKILGFDDDAAADFNWYSNVLLKYLPNDPYHLISQDPEERKDPEIKVDTQVKFFSITSS